MTYLHYRMKLFSVLRVTSLMIWPTDFKVLHVIIQYVCIFILYISNTLFGWTHSSIFSALHLLLEIHFQHSVMFFLWKVWVLKTIHPSIHLTRLPRQLFDRSLDEQDYMNDIICHKHRTHWTLSINMWYVLMIDFLKYGDFFKGLRFSGRKQS